MKRILSWVLAACMMATMALAATACNSTSDTGSGSPSAASSQEVSSKEASSSEASASSEGSSTAVTGKYASVEEYVESDLFQTQLKSAMSSLSGMDLKVTGEGDKLVYTYTYDEGIATDGLASALSSAMETQASTFESLASSLKLAVDVENPVVAVRYLAHDGTEIYSHEYTAK